MSEQECEMLLTAKDISQKCQVSVRKVRRWIDDGELRAIWLGRNVRILPEEFRHFLQRHQIRSEEE